MKHVPPHPPRTRLHAHPTDPYVCYALLPTDTTRCSLLLSPLAAAVVHVVDAVLMPARTLQQVLPYSVAVAGLQPPSAFVPAAAPPGAAPGAARAAAVPAEAAGQPTCFPSIAAAIDGTPQLSILRTLVEVSGVSAPRQLPGLGEAASRPRQQQLPLAG